MDKKKTAHHLENEFHTFVTSAGQQDNMNIILLILSLPMSSRVMVSISVMVSSSFNIFINSASLQKEKHQLKIIIAVLGFLSLSFKLSAQGAHKLSGNPAANSRLKWYVVALYIAPLREFVTERAVERFI